MSDITIPDEALKAMRAKLPPFFSESMARAACIAMLKAWPGAIKGRSLFDGEPTLFLPLQQEKSE